MQLEDDAILARLQIVWEQHSDLRLAQLIGNVYGPSCDPYYIPDAEFIETIEAHYKKLSDVGSYQM